jgi:hypothetical protein
MTAFERLVEAIDVHFAATRGERDTLRAQWSLGRQSFEVEAAGAHRAELRILHGALRPTVMNYDTRLDDLDAFVGNVRGTLVDDHAA